MRVSLLAITIVALAAAAPAPAPRRAGGARRTDGERLGSGALLSVAESRVALRASKTARAAYAARRAEFRLACGMTGGVAALLAYLTDVCLTRDSPLEIPRTGLSKLTGIDRPRLQLLLVAAITIGELWALYRLTLLYAVRVSRALGLPDRPEVRAAIHALVRSTALGAPPLSLSRSAASREAEVRLGLALVAAGPRAESLARSGAQLAISLSTQVRQVLSRGHRQVFRSWSSGRGSSALLVRLSSRFLGREATRLALPLTAVPFWVLWNVAKANAVMAECTALTIGPALAIEAVDGLLPRATLLEMPRAHREAVVRAVAASILHNVRRVQLPLPGFGFSAAAGSVHPNAAALLEHLQARCGIRAHVSLRHSRVPECGPLDSVHGFQNQVLPALDATGRVLALRVLALALCLDGHVNLPDRFFFVRCARAAGMPIDPAAMRQFYALEQLFGAGALDSRAVRRLFEASALRARAEREAWLVRTLRGLVPGARGRRVLALAANRGRVGVGHGAASWWADVLMTVVPS
ncbi:hypothetical protein KFE25_005372 [Diacronema lutheri]|uniref:Uncharacterized protein n=1 Tax=Diacronema lutheri TaxID=2081491 RepID=A0A8J6C8W2_DIALT|nr:hypothetical protein KFE25_005372 [Diacronema lutheri]